MHAEQPPDRFGPATVHVDRFLDRVRLGAADDVAALAAHAPVVTDLGGSRALVCPAGDPDRYDGLVRYRRLLATHPDDRVLAARAEAAVAARHLPMAGKNAVMDAAGALVARGTMHTYAYETLTRAARRAMGRLHPEDGPLYV